MAFDLKTALAGIAPTLATMLAGPLAGTAVSALESSLGLTPGAGSEAVTSAVAAGMTPDAIAAVRRTDQEHEEKLKAMDIDVLRLNADHEAAQDATAAADRDSARKLQIASPSYWPGVLSAVTTSAVLGVIAARMAGLGLPQDPTTVQLIGSLTTGWGMAMAYWFGTTRSSGEKNALLAQSQPASK